MPENLILENNTKVLDETKIMKEIEMKTEKIILTAYKTGRLVNPLDLLNDEKTKSKLITKTDVTNSENLLQEIIVSGANDFEKKTGRQMTYSEMRAMFG